MIGTMSLFGARVRCGSIRYVRSMVAISVELTEVFEWNGSIVRWSRFGGGSPVVVCHGTPWSSLVWRSTIDVLKQNHAVYVWDMIGYGQSDKPDADVSLATQGALLVALGGPMNLNSPDVVAHDYGGAVALRAHLLHGMPVGSFVLVDIVALRPWGSPFFRLVAQNADVFVALPSVGRSRRCGAPSMRLAKTPTRWRSQCLLHRLPRGGRRRHRWRKRHVCGRFSHSRTHELADRRSIASIA